MTQDLYQAQPLTVQRSWDLWELPGIFTSLTFPDAIAIVATGINNRNEITGAYVDQFPHLAHLFVVTANPAESAVPEPGTFILAAGGLLSATSKLRRSSRTAKLQ